MFALNVDPKVTIRTRATLGLPARTVTRVFRISFQFSAQLHTELHFTSRSIRGELEDVVEVGQLVSAVDSVIRLASNLKSLS